MRGVHESLRKKLINKNEMSVATDLLLSLLVCIMYPWLWFFNLIHDKLMYKFLNNTYIYNVSWEVCGIVIVVASTELKWTVHTPPTAGSTHRPSCAQPDRGRPCRHNCLGRMQRVGLHH